MGRLPVVILLITMVEAAVRMALQVGVSLLLSLTVQNSDILVTDLAELVKSSHTLQYTHAPRHTLFIFARKPSCMLLALN